MNRSPAHHRQQGFAMISAIFILVTLSAMGAYLVAMSGMQSRSALFATQGSRAYYAARSGIEWGIYEVVNNGCNPGSLTVEGFTVTVTCTDIDPAGYTEGTDTYHIYRLTAKAERGTYGTLEYVSRQLLAQVGGF